MQAPTDDNSIVLVRAAPGSGETVTGLQSAADALRECSGEVVVFFHGAGVDHATAVHSHDWQGLDGLARLKLEVCSAAWQRRHAGAPMAPFELSSLVRFWHRADSGYRMVRAGPVESEEASPGDPWLIRIGSAPSDPDSREMLEMVLAGASLELPMTVVFIGEGRGHLVGEQVRHWQQLADFDLARLVVLDADEVRPEIPVVTIDDEEFGWLCQRSRGVFLL